MASLKTYLLLNLVVAASYLFFRLGTALDKVTGTLLGSISRMRLGQFLLLSSVFISPMLSQLPREMMPRFSISTLLRDESPALPSLNLPVAKMSRTSSQTAFPQGEMANWTNYPAWIGAVWEAVSFRLIFFLSLVFAFGRLFVRWCEVGTLLRQSMLVHRIGRLLVAVSDDAPVPFSAYRGAKSWVIIPSHLITKPDDFRMALRHEIQHHRQRDTHWAVVIECLVVFLYLNPFIYLWRKTLLEIQEISCDAVLVGHRNIAFHEYGSCLVRVAEAALGTKRVLVGTTGMAVGLKNPNYLKSFLRRRIEMFPEHRAARPRRAATIIIGTIVSIMTLAFAYGSQEVLREDRKPNPGEIKVDPRIQEIASTAIREAIKRHHADAGFAIVSDPDTGRVLAIANSDERPNAKTTQYWALSQQFLPASVVKPLILAAAIEQGATKTSDTYSCENGKYNWDGHVYSDWKPFERLTASEAVVQSSDICSIKVAQKLGIKGILSAYTQFGFGPQGTAEQFPQAIPGLVGPQSSREDSLYLATLATGSALVVTPVEVVGAFGAIANGGNLLRLVANDGTSPQVIRRVMSEATAKQMQLVLADVVRKGTAREIQSKLYSLAGKTGTAQDPSFGPSKSGAPANVASFAGFAPANKPRLVIYVGVIRPTDGDGRVHGSRHAAPVFREIAERTLSLMNVPPDRT